LEAEASDHDLLRRFVSGEESAFTTLMRRHEDRIFAVACRVTGNRADALEATQETFLALFRSAASFRGGAEVGTWLYRIAINASRDVLRRRRRAPVAQEEPAALELGAWHPGAEDAAVARVDVTRALLRLPSEYREAVVMHDLGGIPYDEIARVTGVALGTVKSRISRGRRLLAQALEQHPEAPASKDSS
jgi:RNA polymerase sigma-70 factor (ECF subfamily)